MTLPGRPRVGRGLGTLPSPPPSPQLVQGPGAPGVLLPRLPGAGRRAPEHHRQRHQRGHLHVRGAPAAARAQHLLLARPPAELNAARRAEDADKALSLSSLLALSWEGRRPVLAHGVRSLQPALAGRMPSTETGREGLLQAGPGTAGNPRPRCQQHHRGQRAEPVGPGVSRGLRAGKGVGPVAARPP